MAIFSTTNFELISCQPFARALDVHSICTVGDSLYAVSTGTDELLAYTLRGHALTDERVVWRAELGGPVADLHHLNSVYEWKGDVLVAGFGKKSGPNWSSATDGFIYNVSSGQLIASGIAQPHSIANVDGALAYCSSREMSLRVLDSTPAKRLRGYTRGLCVVGHHVYVASSRIRHQSRSSGLAENPAELVRSGGGCAIFRLTRPSLEEQVEVDISGYGDEIYDLLPAPDAAAQWPIQTAEDGLL